MSTEEIIAALAGSDRADLAYIRLYAAWIRIRRQVNQRFYFRAHWVQPVHREAHWV